MKSEQAMSAFEPIKVNKYNKVHPVNNIHPMNKLVVLNPKLVRPKDPLPQKTK